MNKYIAPVLLLLASAVSASATDYTKGLFIVNEDWYGHRNSTLNHLDPDRTDGSYWHYRAFQEENPGMELGCTTQFATIFGTKFIFISKQAKDPGSTVTGGRITVADANSLLCYGQLENIDPDGGLCDGRSFVGIDSHKGYVSTSDGVWILDIDNIKIQGKIQGTESGTKSLYRGQTGAMISCAGRIFVAHQSKGILVIDPEDDTIETTLSIGRILMDANVWQPSADDLEEIEAGYATLEDCAPGVGCITLDRQGTLWASLSKNTNGTGATYPWLLKIDPKTLSASPVEIPSDITAPSTSWYAWTPDIFISAPKEDCLYWRGGARWFSTDIIYKYNYTEGTFSEFIDLSKEGLNWHIYGCSFRADPDTGNIFCTLYHDNQSQTYITRQYSPDGKILADYPMIENYWFPSLPIFRSTAAAAVELPSVDEENSDDTTVYYTIQGVCLGSEKPSKGIYIAKKGTKTTKIIL